MVSAIWGVRTLLGRTWPALNGLSGVAVENGGSRFVHIAVVFLQNPSRDVGVAPKGTAEYLYVFVIELHGASEVVMMAVTKEDTNSTALH